MVLSNHHNGQRKKGFTLLELLVVLAIVGVLAGLLLPALAKAKEHGRSVRCISNLKQLQLAVHLYAGDNSDLLPPNNAIVTPDNTPTGRALAAGESWCPDRPQTDADTKNLEAGVLFPYAKSVGIYHCPSDTAKLQTTNGQPLPQLRNRSYNLSQSVNGNALT